MRVEATVGDPHMPVEQSGHAGGLQAMRDRRNRGGLADGDAGGNDLLGAGRWALGAGRWALGAGRWALGAGRNRV
ncbi:hypothetical protein HGA13_04535 [Nocardia speluncae]|uniref:Uncharacterized protein n=1 Tax=Nocardia speluncae TaxID=419477 RepID=A0A846X800_9NOCA|nr:hypothetical protein [Nocardia speluncae]NKY32341.1 hypothetical protein [Nocardia speluncae]